MSKTYGQTNLNNVATGDQISTIGMTDAKSPNPRRRRDKLMRTRTVVSPESRDKQVEYGQPERDMLGLYF